MTCTPDLLINVAMREIGYMEKTNGNMLDDPKANAGDGNYTKFARDLDAIRFYNGRKQGYAWCDVFVDWCFYKAFGASAALRLTCQPQKSCGAGCQYSADYYRKRGRFSAQGPRVGDQVFFLGSNGKAAHTGIVTGINGNTITTIEGNTSPKTGVDANGGMVAQKTYRIGSTCIYGYGHPDWDTQESEKSLNASAQDDFTVYNVRQGDTLWSIARTVYGNGNKYHQLMKLNGMKSTLIKPGMTLRVPLF